MKKIMMLLLDVFNYTIAQWFCFQVIVIEHFCGCITFNIIGPMMPQWSHMTSTNISFEHKWWIPDYHLPLECQDCIDEISNRDWM